MKTPTELEFHQQRCFRCRSAAAMNDPAKRCADGALLHAGELLASAATHRATSTVSPMTATGAHCARPATAAAAIARHQENMARYNREEAAAKASGAKNFVTFYAWRMKNGVRP